MPIFHFANSWLNYTISRCLSKWGLPVIVVVAKGEK
ncbi:hypothetical protein [Sulfolobus spindle-shaped virus]|nr:hypothetical protein [Sulfolobus spindle-shaped virus]